MAAVFEYIINVPTRDLDAAKQKLTDLQGSAQKSLETLNKGFKTVGETVKQNIKDYGVLGAAGKGAISGLTGGFKSLTGVTKSLGNVLKANPLFTLAGILLPVIMALKDMILNLDIVQKYFELVGEAINFVIGLLKKFLDFLGLTSFAEDEAAEKAKKAAEDRKAANDALYSSMLRDMEREIALLQAQGANIEEIEEKQLQLARVRNATAQEELRSQGAILEAQIKVNQAVGIATAEQVKQLEELKNAARDAESSLQILEANILKARTDRTKKEIEDQKRTQAEAARLRKEATAKRLADEKAFADARLKAERQIQDLSTALIADQTERELEQNRLKFERLIADTLTNQTLLETEKAKIIKAFEDQQVQAEAAIREKKRLADEAVEKKKIEDRKQIEQEYLDFIVQTSGDEVKIKVKAVTDEFAQKNEKLREFLELGLVTQQEFNERELELARQQAQALLDIEKERLKKEFEENIRATDEKLAIARGFASAANSLASSIFEVSNNLGKQDEKNAQKRAKRQFNVQKALNIVEAGINGAQGVVKAIAQFGPPPSPLGIAGIAAAGIITAAQIAAIASRKFDPGQAADSGGAGAATPPPTPEPVAPQFQLFGRPGTTDLQAPQSREATTQQTVKAIVSETDLADTNARLETIRQQSEL